MNYVQEAHKELEELNSIANRSEGEGENEKNEK